MKTPQWLTWAFGESMDVKEMIIFAAACVILLGVIT